MEQIPEKSDEPINVYGIDTDKVIKDTREIMHKLEELDKDLYERIMGSFEFIFKIILAQSKELQEKCETIDSLERDIGEYVDALDKKDRQLKIYKGED